MYRIYGLMIYGFVLMGCFQSYPTPYYNTQGGESSSRDSCRIPDYAQIVHYPMVHKINELIVELNDLNTPKHVRDFYYPIVVYSQFTLLNIIQRHRSAKVFYEGVSDTLLPEYLKRNSILRFEIKNPEGYIVQVDAGEVSRAFHKDTTRGVDQSSVPENFNKLNQEQKHLLYQLGGGVVAYILGETAVLYRTSTPEEEEQVTSSLTELFEDFYEESSRSSGNQLYDSENQEVLEERAKLRKDIEHIILDVRESYVKREVTRYLEDNEDDLVIIGYGAAHDFSDEFRNYSFYTMPYNCSMSKDFLDSPNFAMFLMSKYIRLLNQPHVSTNTVERRLQQAIDSLENSLASYDSKDESFWNESENRPFNQDEIRGFIARLNRVLGGGDLDDHVTFNKFSWLKLFSIKLNP